MNRSEKPLNHHQEAFCRFLTLPDERGRTMARADAYLLAYGGKKRDVARVAACHLMRDPRVLRRVDELMNNIYGNWLEQALPFTRLVEKVRDAVEDDRHRDPQIRALELALKTRKQYLTKWAKADADHRVASDEELIKSAEALGWRYMGITNSEQGGERR